MKFSVWKSRLLTLSAFLGLLGLSGYFGFDNVIEYFVKYQLQLQREGNAYKIWKELPFPSITKYYFFHINNSESMSSGQKLHLIEKGPFVFKQWRRKEILNWATDKSSVTYSDHRRLYYMPEQSQDWNEEIVTIDPVYAAAAKVLVTALDKASFLSRPFLHPIISGFFLAHKDNIFLKTTPKQMLLGHEMTMLKTVQYLDSVLNGFGVNLSTLMPEDVTSGTKFGLLVKKNSTPFGPFEVSTPLEGVFNGYTTLINYRGRNATGNAMGHPSSKYAGTDGFQFRPFLMKDELLAVFIPDIMRSVLLKRDLEEELRGVQVWTYSVSNKSWDSIDNWNTGYLDVTECMAGTPWMATLPHFLHAGPSFTSQFFGLQPDVVKHDNVFKIEPTLGVPLEATGRVQLNIHLDMVELINDVRLKNMTIPMFWVDEKGTMSDEVLQYIKWHLIYPSRLAWFIIYLSALGAIILFTIVTLMSYFPITKISNSSSLQKENFHHEKLILSKDLTIVR